MDGHGYQRMKVWDHPMLMWRLTTTTMVAAEEMERKVEAKYVEKKNYYYLEVSFYCLYPRKVSLVTALQRSWSKGHQPQKSGQPVSWDNGT